jgi:uncharacterized protein
MPDPNEDPIKGLLSYLVGQLVDEPENAQVGQYEDDASVTYEVRVSQPDLGKVIGKQGRIANALRTIARAGSARDKRKVFVEIVA